MSNSTPTLLDLRHHYATIIAQSEYQSTQAKEQLAHIDALLENELPQPEAFPLLETAAIASHPAIATTIEPTSLPAAQASTAIAKAPAAKTETAIASSEISAPSLLPVYKGLNKLEAIAQILSQQSGHALHQDTIFQLLYGDISPEVLKNESQRIRASLFQGVRKGLWDKSTDQRSSYLAKVSGDRKLKANSRAPASAKPGRKPSASMKVKAIIEGDRITPTQSVTQLQPAKPKQPRKASPAKTTAKPKRKQVEVIALLKKANIKV
jgi:lipoprotein-anchoring transpeptidase ErfK/SrfK